MNFLTRLVLPACLLTCAGTALADTTLTFKSQDSSGEEKGTQRMLIADGKVYLDSDLSGETGVLFDRKSQKVYFLHHEKQMFLSMDRDKMASVSEKVRNAQNEAVQRLQEQIGKLPPEQASQAQSILEKLEGASSKLNLEQPKVEAKFENTGKTEKVGDYQAELFQSYKDGEHQADYYLVDYGDLKVSDEDYATIGEFFDLFENMMSAIPGGNKQQGGFGTLAKAQGKLPVKIVRIEDGGEKETEILEGVSLESLDPKQFAIPSTYTEQQLPY